MPAKCDSLSRVGKMKTSKSCVLLTCMYHFAQSRLVHYALVARDQLA